jgi:hypothetical protein
LLTPLADPRFDHQSNRAALSSPPDERPPHRWRGAGSPGSPSAPDVAMIYREADAFAPQIFAVKEIGALLAPDAN